MIETYKRGQKAEAATVHEEIEPAEFHFNAAFWLSVLAGTLCWIGLGFVVWELWR